MKNHLTAITVIIVSGVILLLGQCKKDSDDYSYCTGCPVDAWVGDFSGTGIYFTSPTGETFEDVDVEVSIENPGGNNLKINITAPNYVSFQFFGSKSNDEHYFTIAGTSQSLDLTLYKHKNGADYKINGTAKTYENKKDSVLVDKSLTFSVFKKLN